MSIYNKVTQALKQARQNNSSWGIDGGKNPPNSPRGEIRDNDRHLSLEEKRKAREAKE